MAICRRGLVGLACAIASTAAAPLYPPWQTHACLPPNDGFPFCDTDLDIGARVADLISRMNLTQKIAARYDYEPLIPAIGLAQFNWNQEGLHGLGAVCLTKNATSGTRCPTLFPAPPALAATFNMTLLHDAGRTIGREARAYSNTGGNRQYQNRPVDLNVWLPNVNIARDPRWGRQAETYSEDPWLTGQLGAQIVDGTQRGDQRSPGGDPNEGNGYLQMIVAAKHATAYQIENNRFGRSVNVSLFDLADTFYPAWEAVVGDQGRACGSAFLETQLMKETWGLGSWAQGGSYVQGDCGAIEDISDAHHFVANQTYGAAVALNAGTDVDCGSGYTNNLLTAIQLGLTTESELDASLTRTYTLQMLAGRFDPIEDQPYMQIPFEDINSQDHQDLALDAALQGMVLLRNDNNLLPLTPGKWKIAVIGPHGNTTGDILGTYFEERCPNDNDNGAFSCVTNLLTAVQQYNNNSTANVSFTQGCSIIGLDSNGIADAVTAAQNADIVILALGTNTQVADEGVDRTNTSLPGLQAQLAQSILQVGKPTIVVLFNGQTLGIDAIVNWASNNSNVGFTGASASPVSAAQVSSSPANQGQPIAIVEAFYPGESGGIPVSMHIFGQANRWGKLPVTMYPDSYSDLLNITDMGMEADSEWAGYPGRTYRYYNEAKYGVLYPFGYGLSYTTFEMSGDCPAFGNSGNVDGMKGAGGVAVGWSIASSTLATLPSINCSITVTNTGSVDGDEVVQVYIRPDADSIKTAHAAALGSVPGASATGAAASPAASAAFEFSDPLPIKYLVAFQRVSVPTNSSVTVPFSINFSSLSVVDSAGNRVVWPGRYGVEFSRGHGSVVSLDAEVAVEHDDASPLVDRIVVRRYPSIKS